MAGESVACCQISLYSLTQSKLCDLVIDPDTMTVNQLRQKAMECLGRIDIYEIQLVFNGRSLTGSFSVNKTLSERGVINGSILYVTLSLRGD
jgi:hypothetical protein